MCVSAQQLSDGLQVIRHAYQLREGTPPGMGPPLQALQPLASGEHHYAIFKHFPASAVKLQVSKPALFACCSCRCQQPSLPATSTMHLLRILETLVSVVRMSACVGRFVSADWA